MENEQVEGKKKSSPLVMTIAGVAILTLLGAGGGWLVGGMIAPKIAGAEAHATAAAGGHGEKKTRASRKSRLRRTASSSSIPSPPTSLIPQRTGCGWKWR